MGCPPEAAGRPMVEDRGVPEVERPQRVSQLIETGRDHEAAQRGMLEATSGRRSLSPVPDQGLEGLMDPLTQLGQLGPVLGGVVAGITPDQLDRKTPCADYTVRGVLEHMIGGATAFAPAFRGDVSPDGQLTGSPQERFHLAMAELAVAVHTPGAQDRTVSAPFGEVPGAVMARYAAFDGLVHGWDLATTTGQPYAPAEALVIEVETFARTLIGPEMRDGDTFPQATDVPVDATPLQRLVAFSGRKL